MGKPRHSAYPDGTVQVRGRSWAALRLQMTIVQSVNGDTVRQFVSSLVDGYNTTCSRVERKAGIER
jgi:hypothetical protein